MSLINSCKNRAILTTTFKLAPLPGDLQYLFAVQAVYLHAPIGADRTHHIVLDVCQSVLRVMRDGNWDWVTYFRDLFQSPPAVTFNMPTRNLHVEGPPEMTVAQLTHAIKYWCSEFTSAHFSEVPKREQPA